jgi:hypothetical protein
MTALPHIEYFIGLARSEDGWVGEKAVQNTTDKNRTKYGVEAVTELTVHVDSGVDGVDEVVGLVTPGPGYSGYRG